MSLTAARMKRLDVVILEKDVRTVTAALGRLGVLHLVEVRPDETGAELVRSRPGDDLEACRSLLQRLDRIRENLRLAELPAPGEDSHEPVSALAPLRSGVAALEEQVGSLVAERAKIEGASAEIQDELARLDALGPFTVPLARVLESPFLHFAIGLVKVSDLRRLGAEVREGVILLDRPGTGDMRRLIAITSRKGRFALETTLKQHNFVRQDLSVVPKGTPAEIMAGLEHRAEQLREQHRSVRQRLQESAVARRGRVAFLYRNLRLEQALIEAQMSFGHTSSTCLISGWLPEDCLAVVSERLLEETGGRMILRVRGPALERGAALEDVPVMMKNPPVLRPFELLVNGLGVPCYDEIEPTLLLAVSFLAMYGLMFGDVGQGAVLALIGGLVHWRSRDRQVRDLGAIILYAGLAAILGGFLYGSVFGKDDLLPPLWFSPMRDVSRILEVPIVLGVLLISVGVVLNIVNRFRAHDYLRGILDRFGLVGIVFYWGALGLGVRYALLGAGAANPVHIGLLIGVPLLILFFREPILHMLTRRGGHPGPGVGGFSSALRGGVEILETISTYLANTVSFARVGAFALAHAGLCVAIFSLEEAVRELPAGMLWSGVVLVLGNAIVILLEGLIVFVQCLRLEYYEFFSKFFSGTGKKYNPFRTV